MFGEGKQRHTQRYFYEVAALLLSGPFRLQEEKKNLSQSIDTHAFREALNEKQWTCCCFLAALVLG
jgi:hypothetical protein